MSLSFEQFDKAQRAWDEMDKRLTTLIGFNPAIGNHYGVIRLYNKRINSKTSDEEIINIRSAYVKWRDEIIAILSENGLVLEDEQFNSLFSVNFMYGTVAFLGTTFDIHQNTDMYREIIGRLLDDKAQINDSQEIYRKTLRGLKR